MRAADAAEKLTLEKPEYLRTHKTDLLKLLFNASAKELKWHLVAMCSRVDLNEKQTQALSEKLREFINDKEESRIVRVFSLQALYDISEKNPEYREAVRDAAKEIFGEKIPSINSRIRKLKLLP